MAQYLKTESIGSIGSIILAILEVQVYTYIHIHIQVLKQKTGPNQKAAT